MDTVIVLLVFFIVFFLVINVVCAICTLSRLRLAKVQDITIDNISYADIHDPYDRPYVLKGFITLEHCRKIIEMADGKLFDSEILGGKNPEIRNSQQCWLSKYDPLVRPIIEKISKMYQIPFENAENLQVVRYLPGQYYKEHHDSCCDDNDKCIEFIRKAGQRVITVLIYLNNDFTGGYTYFKNLGVKLKPSPGDAIVFFPLAKGTRKCHPLALHAGMPVISGTKWVANVWFRESQYG
jgi:prolyl 4-hydroxylase